MGTRGLTCVIVDDEHIVAQYHQWDSYPSGQGAIILDYLSNKMDKPLLIEKLKQCKFGSNLEIGQLWKDCGADDSGFVNMEVSDKFKERYPQLERGMGGDVLNFIQRSEGEILLGDELEFADDALLCEWAYLIDMDTNEFKVFKGFQTKTVPEELRFPGSNGDGGDDKRNEYTSVKLVKTYPLDDLPTQEEFENDVDPEPIDEEDIMAVIDHIRSGDHGNEDVTERICNFMEANMDSFMEAFEE